MEEKRFTEVATIPQTAARCKAEGLGLTAYQLRYLCKSGQLVHTMMGTKTLIFWPNLLELLESGTPDPPPPEVGTIRRIEE